MNWLKFAKDSKERSTDGKPRVLLVSLPEMWGMTEGDLEPLRAVAEVDWVQTKSITERELGKRCAGYDYLMLNMDPMPFPDPNKIDKLTEVFYKSPGVKGLKCINVDMTDVDFFSPGIAKRLGIDIQSCPDAVTESVAESALTEILLHARNRHLATVDVLKDRDVECRESIDLKGKTAGIIGKGNIGSRVGSFLEAMGMRVLYCDVNPELRAKDSLESIFRESCVVSIHVPCHQPHTNKTNIGLIDGKLLGMCKDLILVNLATDIIVDNDALKDALESGRVRGYSIEGGRRKSESLRRYEGVHMSPCSYNSKESVANVKRIWISNMISAVEGNPQNLWI
jgi:phosphoglycerate dehydrogenase-like enzyme